MAAPFSLLGCLLGRESVWMGVGGHVRLRERKRGERRERERERDAV
jgi:hypothetical protein